MASKTIIIESNRNIAYQNSTQETNTTEYVGATEEAQSNNRWETYIPDGLPINVGDQINLEASMINSIGGGDEVMEFTGNTNLKYGGDVISDNSVRLTINYYISNRYQFNFNFPKSTCQVNYDMSSPDYGGPAFVSNKATATTVDHFNAWESNYPYQCIEGFSTDVTQTPRVYTVADASLKPSFMKPPPDLYNPSDVRLWIGNFDYQGPYYSGNARNVYLNTWKPYASNADLVIPKGFSTPASVGEVLTSQLHSRQGDAVSWDVLNVTPKQYNIDGTTGAITSRVNPGITDATYLTFPTSTGKLFYQREQGNWNGAFAGEKAGGQAVPVGTNYDKTQGEQAFYNYIMTAQPEYYRGMTTCYTLLQQQPAGTLSDLSKFNYTNFTVHTGANAPGGGERYVVNTNYGVGVMGNNVCTMDKLPSEVKAMTYYDTKEKKEETINADALKLQQGNAISTNIICNTRNIADICEYIQYAFFIDADSTHQDRNNKAFLESHVIPFYFGRIDDQQSSGAGGRIVQLSCPSQGIDSIASNAYYEQENTLVDGTVVTEPTMIGRTQWIEHKHSVYAVQYDRTSYNAINAMSNSIPGCENLFPHNPDSKFQTAHPTGDFTKLKEVWDQINSVKIQNLGLTPMVIPVYYKDGDTATASKMGPNAYDVPFLAFIFKDGNQGMPCPVEGEFCMFDTSLSACQMSIIATTQKIQTGGLYPQPSTANGGINTRPEQYMPYCYAGASDALINFDAGYSKFTLSQFHTPTTTGNGPYQNPTEPTNTAPESVIMTVNEQEAHMCSVDATGVPVGYIGQIAVPIKQPVISAQAGIAIEFISVYLNTGRPLSTESAFQLEYYNQGYYVGTILDKLGFSYEQICPFYGQSQCQFNRGNYNQFLGTDSTINVYNKYLNMVKPFTTNAYISSAEQLSFTQQLAITKTAQNNTIDIVVPSAKLGGTVLKQSTTNAVSDLMIGVNMPRKLSYPYLVVYTDIIRNAIYYGGPNGHERLNAIAYITRNYAEGDFFYSFTTNWTYTADTNYVITSITTDIRLPDGTPAPIDNNSSVIYKVTKPQAMPLPPTLPPPIQKKRKEEQDKDA